MGIKDAAGEIGRVLKIVRMEDAAHIKFKSCSLGMKQRIGIAMALLGYPVLLILYEPINGLDADGMRIMREILVDITKTYGCTVLISSHILSELEKIATHYGIIRQGKMLRELTAADLEGRARVLISVKTADDVQAFELLRRGFPAVRYEDGQLNVYGEDDPKKVTAYLLENGQAVREVRKNKIGLEEYYVELMSKKEAAYA